MTPGGERKKRVVLEFASLAGIPALLIANVTHQHSRLPPVFGNGLPDARRQAIQRFDGSSCLLGPSSSPEFGQNDCRMSHDKGDMDRLHRLGVAAFLPEVDIDVRIEEGPATVADQEKLPTGRLPRVRSMNRASAFIRTTSRSASRIVSASVPAPSARRALPSSRSSTKNDFRFSLVFDGICLI